MDLNYPDLCFLNTGKYQMEYCLETGNQYRLDYFQREINKV